ncbi:hypothetical protein [Devosia sp. FJ2-5-3]|uniref:hypothetical protein n=1 Tax=Devosia sp. FJ2-5-3 TaxID=2976680 RepID=UPI0023D7DC6F|nr:hypothetical protein [Devosia sp. FJ2-5-3]WEJ60253.1 hypothetical protein N0P34_09525 [Devosia sp. FJ2-5-3]
MARTLIGQLILRMQQNVTAEARKVEQALGGIESKARALGNMPWGARMQRQLELLKVSPQEAAAVRRSWDNLMTSIQNAGLSGKNKRSAIADWRTSTVAHFADVRNAMAQTEARARKFAGRLSDYMKPLMVAGGFYTAAYGGGLLVRGGLTAGSEREREIFRQDMAGIPLNEQAAIQAKAAELSQRYRSVDATQIMELARTARNTMGTTERGLEILEQMVAGYVATQSAKGVDAAPQEIGRLIRGLDNLGFNAGGEIGIEHMQQIIAGAVRAVQIEGYELDMGTYFDFARRAKIAGPALSADFMTSVAPALMQDMTAHGAGTAIASGYQALVTGSSAVASKVNLAEQRRLGLRSGEGGPQGFGGLVDAGLYGQNPYQWIKEHLVPALERDGVNMADETAVSQAVAKISRNTMATGLWTRMITQQDQIDRNMELYSQAMGPEAGAIASERDPFVAYEGFLSSMSNLSGAIAEHMDIIVPGLNSMTDMLNGLANAVKENPLLAAGGVAAAGAGAFAIGSVAWSWISAGPSLQTAATMLQAAATSLQGGGLTDLGNGGKGKGNWLQNLLGLGATVAVAAGPGVLSELTSGSPSSVEDFDAQVAEQGRIKAQMWDWINSLTSNPGPADPSPYEQFRGQGASWGLNPDATSVDTSGISAVGTEADVAAAKLGALSTTLRPMVDVNPITRLIALLERAVALQRQLGSGPASGGNLSSRVTAAYPDYGVAP